MNVIAAVVFFILLALFGIFAIALCQVASDADDLGHLPDDLDAELADLLNEQQ